MMIIGIIPAMKALIKVKHPHDLIKPLPNKRWSECYESFTDGKNKFHVLHYHTVGDPSSHSVMIQY